MQQEFIDHATGKSPILPANKRIEKETGNEEYIVSEYTGVLHVMSPTLCCSCIDGSAWYSASVSSTSSFPQ